MSDEIKLNKSLSDKEIYEALLPQVEGLLDESLPVITNLSNFNAALFNAFNKISWCGFYLVKKDLLVLGPFQGNTACTIIKPGKGVCGTSFSNKETVIVEDVDKFPGHIACDSGSKSEIVLPVTKNNNIFGVLDLDSYSYSAFNDTDKFYLLKFLEILNNKINLEDFTLS